MSPRRQTVASRALLVAVVCAGVALGGCGRKGSLEYPGTGLAPQASQSMTDTTVRENDLAPRLGRRRDLDRRLAEQPVGPDNADAPEVGDAIPEGPGAGVAPQRRRFLLDFLL